jgi:hypothetical protein
MLWSWAAMRSTSARVISVYIFRSLLTMYSTCFAPSKITICFVPDAGLTSSVRMCELSSWIWSVCVLVPLVSFCVSWMPCAASARGAAARTATAASVMTWNFTGPPRIDDESGKRG